MKKILLSYARYHSWANQQLFQLIRTLPVSSLHQPIVNSFPSVAATIHHMWSAEFIWWQRIKLTEPVLLLEEALMHDPVQMIDTYAQLSQQIEQWVNNATEAALQHEFIYRNSKKVQFKQPVHEVLMHLFNHQTYHRGQLVTLLRQLGVDKIPATDYIVFLRKK